ncbi:MAG: DUF2341 domain-containing protein [Candidatus Aenigmarchaeota archaeon]|nr:DUF2341 domain-containing protein [Candidatus Aenigmarchaeota archaeon]
MIKEKNKSLNLKGVSPIIAVILLVMIVIGMGLTAYLFFSRTQETLQKGTEEQAGKAFEAMYSKIKIESVTKEKIYIRNAGSFEINSTSLTLYVNNETYSFTIGTEILEPNRVYALQLSQPLGEQDYLIKVTAGAGIEDSRYVNLAITTTTTTTSIPITITTTTIPPGVTTTTTTLPPGVTTTTLPNTPPVVTPVSFSGSTNQGSVVTFMTNATDNEQSSSSLTVRLWVGVCTSGDCSSSSNYQWILDGVQMSYYAGNEFRYQWTINQPAGSIIGATCQAIDNQGATSNWGDRFPIFTVGVQPTTTTLTTTTSTTSTTTTTTISWYFSNLPKRRAINVTNSGSALTNYQLALNISYSSSMTYNFADLRFTYFNGSAEQQIPYWLETYQANSWAKVWVKVPSIPSGTSRLYVYYGNSSLLSESNFDQVFTKNFEDSDLVGLWHFDEGSGTSVSDASGNGNNGNIINQNLGTYWVASDGGQWDGRSDVKFSTGASINFTNAFSFVEVPHSSSLNLQNAITIEAWVNPRAIGGSFSYRRPITITNTAGALTDYQVLVTLDTASLISQGKMRSDCGDIRFTDSDGATKLSYWIESGCNSANTRIWIKIPSIPRTSTKLIYMYYGNSSVTSESNGAAVFDFFDDFNTLDTSSRWYPVAGSNYQVSNGILRINQGAIGLISALPFNLNSGYMVESRIQYNTNSESDYSGVLETASYRFIAGGNANSDATVLYMVDYPSGNVNVKGWVANGASTGYNIANAVSLFDMSLNTWYIIGIETTSSTVGFWRDYSRIANYSLSWSKNMNYISLGYYAGLSNNIKDTSYDWVRIRKYRSPEPTTSVGSEQSSQSQTNWLYRRPITINNPGSAKTNYQVLVTIDTASLISQGKMRSDCGDIRFTDSDGVTWLEYFLEGGCNTNATQVWIVVPSIPSGSKKIYMYYGNPDAVSASLMWNGQFIVLSDVPCDTPWTRFSQLDNRFPRGSSSYGGTGGSETHTHTTSGPSATKCVDSSPCTTNVASDTHTHTATANHLPPYLNMIFCSSNNLYLRRFSIAMFSTSSLPSGWTRFSQLDNRFPRGSSSYGGTGGSETHTHTTSGPSATKCVYSPCVTNVASDTHTHTVSTENHLPPYIDTIFAQVNSDGPAPSGTIVMATSLPPLGWTRVSSFDNRFPRGSSSYGGTGGSETHTHTLSGPSATKCVDSSPCTTNVASDTHTHTATANHLPPYLDVLFIQKNSQDVTTSVGAEEMRFMINKGTNYGLGANTTHAFGIINNNRISAPIPQGWVFIALTYDGSYQRLYVNGLESASTPKTETIATSNSPLIIFNPGILDEVRIYNRALSQNEIIAHYERRKYSATPPSYVIGSEETR